MSDYIRSCGPAAKLFFTVRLLDRRSTLLVDQIERLRDATRATRNAMPFEIDEIVVLPSVIHTIWTLPEGDSDFGKRWRMLKMRFSRSLPKSAKPDLIGFNRPERAIWQRRFWEHPLRDAQDIAAHRHMILTAPVQAGLVEHPQQWPHSSIHRAFRLGQFDPAMAIGTFEIPPRSKKMLKTG